MVYRDLVHVLIGQCRVNMLGIRWASLAHDMDKWIRGDLTSSTSNFGADRAQVATNSECKAFDQRILQFRESVILYSRKRPRLEAVR